MYIGVVKHYTGRSIALSKKAHNLLGLENDRNARYRNVI